MPSGLFNAIQIIKLLSGLLRSSIPCLQDMLQKIHLLLTFSFPPVS